MIPKDNYILLSYLNTKLRDSYPTLEELAKSECANIGEICDKMSAIGYHYDSEKNAFVR